MLKHWSDWRPADLAALFIEHDLQPLQGFALSRGDDRFYSGVTISPEPVCYTLACATGVLALHEGYRGYEDTVCSITSFLQQLGYDGEWLDGIEDGFDAIGARVDEIRVTTTYRLGQKLGYDTYQLLMAMKKEAAQHEQTLQPVAAS